MAVLIFVQNLSDLYVFLEPAEAEAEAEAEEAEEAAAEAAAEAEAEVAAEAAEVAEWSFVLPI